MIDFTSFSPEDLAAELSFRKWITHEDQEAVDFWEGWILAHPEKKEVVALAATLVSLLNMPKQSLPVSEIDEEIRRVEALIQEDQQKTKGFGVLGLYIKNWRVAAIFIGILFSTCLTYFFFFHTYSNSEYFTKYGEIREVKLPDGSVVTLSGNTHLKILGDWSGRKQSASKKHNGDKREVFLEGMAYFKVKHISRTIGKDNPIKFVVYAAGVEVEVIGTEFNVSNRTEKVKVVLNSGKIQLRIQKKKDLRQFPMKPGELMELEKTNNTYQLKQINPNHYTLWKDGQLKFDHTPLTEVAALIEEAYGYKVYINSNSLKIRELSGVIQNRNLNFMLKTLSTLLDVGAKQKDNTITLYEQSSNNY